MDKDQGNNNNNDDHETSDVKQPSEDEMDKETGLSKSNLTNSKGKPGRKRKLTSQRDEEIIDSFLILSYATLEELEV